MEKNSNIDKKICLKCDCEKPNDEFHKDVKIKNGLKKYCKLCSKYYQKDKEEILKAMKI